MATVTRSSLPEQVFQQLVEAVFSGRYSPGDRLPTQRTLAADLGVNMASLREGIKRLEQLRLVDVRQGDAMRVRDWREVGGLDVLAYAAVSDPAVVRSLFEARRLLLREAARLAAERRSEEQAASLSELAEAVRGAADDEAAQALDLVFFEAVIEASGNLVFRLIMNSIGELYVGRMELFRALVSNRDELVPVYRRAARAIAAGRARQAAAAVEQLAALQETRMVRALG